MPSKWPVRFGKGRLVPFAREDWPPTSSACGFRLLIQRAPSASMWDRKGKENMAGHPYTKRQDCCGSDRNGTNAKPGRTNDSGMVAVRVCGGVWDFMRSRAVRVGRLAANMVGQQQS